MNEPRRLSKSGGVSQRLLDSASLDKPSDAARRRAALLAATASSFSTTTTGGAPSASAHTPPIKVVKTLATWIFVGAAASVTLGFASAKLFEASPAPRAAAALLPSPPSQPAASSPDISPEPANVRLGQSTGQPRPSVASSDELREIEAARAAVSRGDDSSAIAQLDDYDSSHPNGQLKPDSMALRIQALSHSGKTSDARRLANEFQEKYPGHPLLQQVNRALLK